MEKGNEDNKNLAFVEVDNMPTYSLCLLKRGITTNDDEIFENAIKGTGSSLKVIDKIPYDGYEADGLFKAWIITK